SVPRSPTSSQRRSFSSVTSRLLEGASIQPYPPEYSGYRYREYSGGYGCIDAPSRRRDVTDEKLLLYSHTLRNILDTDTECQCGCTGGKCCRVCIRGNRSE